MLTVSNLTCSRNGRTLFSGLGFCLQEGGVLLLKGGNGSGKTSLIEIMAGVLPADAGEVLWKGAPITGNEDFARELVHIGHKSDISEVLTVAENLTLWGRQYDTQMLVPAALRFYDLEDFSDQRLDRLSVGVQRRVALSKLMFAPGKLWLLDEPTNFLDEEALLLTTSLIESRVKQGGIVIIATHIMNAVHTLALGDFLS